MPAAQEDRINMPNLPHLRDDRDFSLRVISPDLPETPAAKPRSRRLVIFCSACLPVLVLGLAYTLMRPAEYQAAARLQIMPAAATPATVTQTAGVPQLETRAAEERGSKSFLTEVQILTSRPLVEDVVGQLTRSGDLPADIGSDPVDAVQR